MLAERACSRALSETRSMRLTPGRFSTGRAACSSPPGVLDPMLKPYAASGGAGFKLSKLMSPCGHTSRPVFLPSEAKARRFDSVEPTTARTWLTDWIGHTIAIQLTWILTPQDR